MAITVRNIPNIGSPPDDPNCPLPGTLYVPDPAVHPPPWPCVCGSHEPGFAGSTTLNILSVCLGDLANAGFLGLAFATRSTIPIPRQTTDGKYPQQQNDLTIGVQAMRSNPFGFGYSVTGFVGVIGGSGSAYTALFAAMTGTQGTTKADAAIAMSPPTDMGDPIALAQPGFAADVTTYGRTGNPPTTAERATLTSESPIALALQGSNPILHYNGDRENMPLSQQTLFSAAMGSAGVSNYTAITNTGTLGRQHSFGMWPTISGAATAWLINAASTPPPPPRGKPSPAGIFSLMAADTLRNPIGDIATSYGPEFANPVVTTMRFQGTWEVIGPTNGSFNWTNPDTTFSLAKANTKRVGINVRAGVGTPAWVYTAGATSYALADGSGTMPIPWEQPYQDLHQVLVEAFAAKYENDPALAYVVIDGFSQNSTLSMGNATDEANLNAIAVSDGYTDVYAAWLDAAKKITTSWANLFPTTPIVITLSQVFPSNAGKALQFTYRDWALATFPKHWGTLITGLRGVHAQQPPPVKTTTPTLYQMAWWAAGNIPGDSNPDIYTQPLPNPYPPDPTGLFDCLERGVSGGGWGCECWKPDLEQDLAQTILLEEGEKLKANSPDPQSPPPPTKLHTPTFSPPAGDTGTDVTITCSDTGAHLFYTLGTNPDTPTHSGDVATGTTVRIGSNTGIVNSGAAGNLFKALASQPDATGAKQKLAGIIELIGGPTIDDKLHNLQTAQSLTQAWVDGYRFRVGWDEICPTNSTPDWTKIDSAIATCVANNKVISLSVSAGINTPAWVYDTGPPVDRFNVDTGQGAFDMPFGFQANYLTKWDAFVAAFGAKYDSNPIVRSVFTTGMGQQVAEFHITANSTDQGEYAAAATTAGYVAGGGLTVESVALRATITHVVNTFDAAFPTTPVLFTGGNPWGPGVPFGVADQNFARDLMTGNPSNLRGTCESFLHATVDHTNVAPTPVSYPIGDQAISASNDDTRFYAPPLPGAQPPAPQPIYDLTQNGYETKDQYIEIYSFDINNSVNATTLASQRLKLYSNAQVTPPSVTDSDVATSGLYGTQTSLPLPTVFNLPFHPVDDPLLTLHGYLYIPNPAIWGTGPFPALIGTRSGGFTSGGPNASNFMFHDIAGTAVSGLTGIGFLCLYFDCRLAKDLSNVGGLPGQTTDGRFAQQTDDCAMAMLYMRDHPLCNGFVAMSGGSGSAGHAAYMAVTGTPGTTRPDAAVSLSGELDASDRETDVTTPFVDIVELYYETSDLPTLEARSPIHFVDADTPPIYFANGQHESMPYSVFTRFKAKLDSIPLFNYVSHVNINDNGSRHSFDTYAENANGIKAFLSGVVISPPPDQLHSPTFLPNGSADENVNVTISCIDAGAHIFYTVGDLTNADPPMPTHDGDIPTLGTIRIGANSGIANSGSGLRLFQALAYQDGFIDSPISRSNVFGTGVIIEPPPDQLHMPTFTPNGSVHENVDFTISCEDVGAHIFYTVGGSQHSADDAPNPTHINDTPTGSTQRIGSNSGVVNAGPGINSFKALAYQVGFTDSLISTSALFGVGISHPPPPPPHLGGMRRILENAILGSDLGCEGFRLLNIGTIQGETLGLVDTTDDRLSDSRDVPDDSVTNVKVASNAGIDQSKLDLDGDMPIDWIGNGSTQAAQGNLVQYASLKGSNNGYVPLQTDGTFSQSFLTTGLGAGTITSIQLVLPAPLQVLSAEITHSGTIAGTVANVADNTWFGIDGGVGINRDLIPSFLTTAVPVELVPSLPTSQFTTGTFDVARFSGAVGLGTDHAPGILTDPGVAGTGDPKDYFGRDMNWQAFVGIPLYQPQVQAVNIILQTYVSGKAQIRIRNLQPGVNIFHRVVPPSTHPAYIQGPSHSYIILVDVGNTVQAYAARAGYNNSVVTTFIVPPP